MSQPSLAGRPQPTRRQTGRPSRKPFAPRPGGTGTTGDHAGLSRRASVSVTAPGGRSSKTSQKLVVLPSAPQTKPLEPPPEDDDELGYETDAGRVRSHKSEGERLNKEQRRRRGCKRITAYFIAEALKMKALAGFLRREHNVIPRIFDEAMYAVSMTSVLRE
jgi:uncharacterized Rmd1/YagE family protein